MPGSNSSSSASSSRSSSWINGWYKTFCFFFCFCKNNHLQMSKGFLFWSAHLMVSWIFRHQNWVPSITVIQVAETRLEIGFDIWLLETCQLCLIFISKGHFLLKKIIQGHKGQKGQWRPTKANKGQHSPKLQISLLLSIFNVKSSTNVNKIPEKCVFKKLKISISTT